MSGRASRPTPTRGARIRDAVLDGKMWAALSGQKNPYFAFLWGATRTPLPPAPPAIASAAAELAQFPPGPRVHVAVDHTSDARYQAARFVVHHGADGRHREATPSTSPIAWIEDFLWQRGPWRLQDAGNTAEVYPGVDFLAAYWAARANGFVSDDAPTTCARWAP